MNPVKLGSGVITSSEVLLPMKVVLSILTSTKCAVTKDCCLDLTVSVASKSIAKLLMTQRWANVSLVVH